MTCEACGHAETQHLGPGHLCAVCFIDHYGGPCFPWEFR